MIRRLFMTLLALLTLGGVARAQDASEFVLRLSRLEGQVRSLSGEVEKLQYDNRVLKEQLRKFQEDVEFRFQERSGGRPAAQPAPSTQTPAAQPRTQQKRGDAYDPEANPTAPGAPRQLGTTQPSAPLPERRSDVNPPPSALPQGSLPSYTASLDGGRDVAGIIEEDEGLSGAAPLDLDATRRASALPNAPVVASRTDPSVAATGSADPRGDYDAAYAYLLQRQYEQAEMGFRRFVQSHPRDKLVPDATFWLGESYLQRNRHREAAEQFLKVSTEYGRSAKAPDAMLKLGVALAAIGAKDQACATFAELGRKFPQATATLRTGVEREQRRARCTA